MFEGEHSVHSNKDEVIQQQVSAEISFDKKSSGKSVNLQEEMNKQQAEGKKKKKWKIGLSKVKKVGSMLTNMWKVKTVMDSKDENEQIEKSQGSNNSDNEDTTEIQDKIKTKMSKQDKENAMKLKALQDTKTNEQKAQEKKLFEQINIIQGNELNLAARMLNCYESEISDEEDDREAKIQHENRDKLINEVRQETQQNERVLLPIFNNPHEESDDVHNRTTNVEETTKGTDLTADTRNNNIIEENDFMTKASDKCLEKDTLKTPIKTIPRKIKSSGNKNFTTASLKQSSTKSKSNRKVSMKMGLTDTSQTLQNPSAFSNNEKPILITEEIKKHYSKIIIHIHGGGFMAMSSSYHQNYLRRYANYLKYPIFSIDYRLAPKFKYPEP